MPKLKAKYTGPLRLTALGKGKLEFDYTPNLVSNVDTDLNLDDQEQRSLFFARIAATVASAPGAKLLAPWVRFADLHYLPDEQQASAVNKFLHDRELYVWQPEKYGCVKIACPKCSSSDRVESKGWAKAIFIKEVGHGFYLAARRRKCSNLAGEFLESQHNISSITAPAEVLVCTHCLKAVADHGR